MSKILIANYCLIIFLYILLIYGFTMFPRSFLAELKRLLKLEKFGETHNSFNRRNKEDFFKKYTNGLGLDIGYGGDLVTSNCVGWDMDQGNAQELAYIQDNFFDFVYSSHCLEHMVDLEKSLKNWWRVLKPQGYLIITVPERDLFEKKKNLPSLNNPDHKHFFLLDQDEKPDTVGLVPLIEKTLKNYSIIYAKVCNDQIHNKFGVIIGNEYQIEAVIQKTS